MNEIAPRSVAHQLGVAVLSLEPERRAALEAVVTEAGHAIVDLETADVVLTDAEAPSHSKPVLVVADREADRESWLSSNASAAQIGAALTAIAAGLYVRPREEPKSARFEEMAEPRASELLSPRELEILTEISAGRSNKSIARTLGISLHTVKFHIESLLRKLGARTRAEAVAKALERRTRNQFEI
jgi:DNA-binding NarL/FixJ family response regulator